MFLLPLQRFIVHHTVDEALTHKRELLALWARYGGNAASPEDA